MRITRQRCLALTCAILAIIFVLVTKRDTQKKSLYDAFPLAASQIRLLVLEPGDAFNDGIRGRLEVLDMFSNGSYDYEALSYTWGSDSSSARRKANINGQSISITDNLDDALRHLRYPWADRRLWVDAICINQQNVTEKSMQVPLMGQVYTRARRAVVWLGPLDDDRRTAIKAIRQLGADIELHMDSEFEHHAIVDGLTFESEKLRSTLIGFFHISWFRRIWTAQEILLAKDAMFYCGAASFDLKTLLQYIYHSSRHWLCCRTAAAADMAHGIATRSPSLLDEITLLIMTFGLRKDYYYEHLLEGEEDDDTVEREEYLPLLAQFRHRQASNPRDLIYGCLALARADFQSALKPDYRLSVEQVFTDAALAMIAESRNLEILSHAYGNRSLDLPSWVPDWTARIDDLLTYQLRHQNLVNFAAGGTWRSVPTLVDGIALLVEGTVFDDIVATTPAAGEVSNKELLSHAQAIAGLGGQMGDDPRIEQSSLATQTSEGAFWRVFLDGLDSFYQEEMDLSRYTNFQDPTGVSLPSVQASDSTIIRAWLSHFLADDFTDADPELMRVQVGFVGHSSQRRFVRTRQGHFGFAPDSCEPGDKVAVLLGGPMVYALREVDGHSHGLSASRAYKLLGDAKLSGNPTVRDGVAQARGDADLQLLDIHLV